MEIQGINSSININHTQSQVGIVQSNEFKELLDNTSQQNKGVSQQDSIF